jgi:hypothetical protein
MDVVGNAYKPSAETLCEHPMISIDPVLLDSVPRTRIFLSDNALIDRTEECVIEDTSSPIHDLLERMSAWSVPQWKLVPASTLYPEILESVGARPAARNPIDARVIAGIREGSGKIIENEMSVGGWPLLPMTNKRNSLPVSTSTLADTAVLAAVGSWLCQQRQIVEGRQGECD